MHLLRGDHIIGLNCVYNLDFSYGWLPKSANTCFCLTVAVLDYLLLLPYDGLDVGLKVLNSHSISVICLFSCYCSEDLAVTHYYSVILNFKACYLSPTVQHQPLPDCRKIAVGNSIPITV